MTFKNINNVFASGRVLSVLSDDIWRLIFRISISIYKMFFWLLVGAVVISILCYEFCDYFSGLDFFLAKSYW